MSKRLTKEGWRALGVYNAADLCKRGERVVYIAYIPAQTGRAYRSAKWQVKRPGYQTDPNTHWTNYGNKTFNVYKREEKEPMRLEAIAWASKRYGITEWERDPWGDYHPLGTMESARKSLEAAITPEP